MHVRRPSNLLKSFASSSKPSSSKSSTASRHLYTSTLPSSKPAARHARRPASALPRPHARANSSLETTSEQTSSTAIAPIPDSSSPAAAPSSASPPPPEEDKPKRRPGRPATKPPSAATAPNASTPDFPADYAFTHLWLPSPTPPTTPPPGLPPPHILHEALTSLLLTLHPQTQHRSLYSGPNGQNPQVEPTLAMYCPIEGGDYVVDATVREVARRAGAEVVVFDTAQLAAGAYGVFGKAASTFQLPHNPLHVTSAANPSSTSAPSPFSSSNSPAMDDDEQDPPHIITHAAPTLTIQVPTAMHVSSVPLRSGRLISSSSAGANGGAGARTAQMNMRKFFDDIVNLSGAAPPSTEISDAVVASSDSPASPPSPPLPPRPRIIYIRDFPLLAPTSSYWYPSLLASVRQRRSGPLPRPAHPPPNPTVILFGCSPPLLPQLHVLAPSSGGGGILGMLMNQARGPSVRVEAHDEEDARGRERRLRERLAGWERAEGAWLASELPRFGGSPSQSAGTNGRGMGEPVGIVLGGGFMGIPHPESDEPPHHHSSERGEGGRAAAPYFRALTLLPAARDPSRETACRLARRREMNTLAMRMAVGALGGALPPLDGDESELAAEEMWRDWGRRVEPWAAVREVAGRAVGGVVADQLASAVYATLDPTPVPWAAVLDSWAAQRAAGAVRRAWVEAARGQAPPEEERVEASGGETAQEDEVIDRVKRAEDLDENEQRLLGCIVDPAGMPTTFASVHLPAATIDSIRTLVSLPLLYPQAFSQGILKQHAMTGALLFGVPGTGKTLVVRALARESGARMLMIKPSDIMDMYVGQSEKLVRAVFTLARRLAPCVIFLDEIDSLFGARVSARESGGAIAHRSVITEFMQEMDGLRTKEGGVIVIGATNRPFDLDDAVLRRLPRRLLVDLPGEKEREEILKILLRDENLFPDVDIKALAKRTEGFSGSDLKHLCVSAALDAVKEGVVLPWNVPRRAAPEFDTSSVIATPPPPAEPSLASADTEVPIAAELSSDADGGDAPPIFSRPVDPSLPPPIPRVLRAAHFVKALTEITASTSESLGTLSDLRKWNEEYGEGGSKRGNRRRFGDKFGFGIGGEQGGEGRVAREPDGAR